MKTAVCLVLLAATIAGCGDSEDAATTEIRNDSLTGAASPTGAEAQRWPAKWCQVEPGMTRSQMVEIMGEPTEEWSTEQTSDPSIAWDAFEFSYTAFYAADGTARQLQVNGTKKGLNCAATRKASAATRAVGCLDDAGVDYVARNPENARLVGDGEIANIHIHSSDAAARAFYDQLYPAIKIKTEVIDRRTMLYSQGTGGPLAAAVADCGLPPA